MEQDSPEINLHAYGYHIFGGKESRILDRRRQEYYSGTKTDSSINDVGKTGQLQVKKK